MTVPEPRRAPPSWRHCQLAGNPTRRHARHGKSDLHTVTRDTGRPGPPAPGRPEGQARTGHCGRWRPGPEVRVRSQASSLVGVTVGRPGRHGQRRHGVGPGATAAQEYMPGIASHARPAVIAGLRVAGLSSHGGSISESRLDMMIPVPADRIGHGQSRSWPRAGPAGLSNSESRSPGATPAEAAVARRNSGGGTEAEPPPPGPGPALTHVGA